MEFSNEVLQGLTYLASGNYISDENFKKLVNSCLGLLSGEQNIERKYFVSFSVGLARSKFNINVYNRVQRL